MEGVRDISIHCSVQRPPSDRYERIFAKLFNAMQMRLPANFTLNFNQRFISENKRINELVAASGGKRTAVSGIFVHVILPELTKSFVSCCAVDGSGKSIDRR